MIQTLTLPQKDYSIPAILCLPDDVTKPCPVVILCHGTGSHKDEVGMMFARLSVLLAARGIASVRFDFAGCGDSQAPQQSLTFLGEVSDTQVVYEMLLQHSAIDPKRIGILGFSQGARVMAEFLRKSYHDTEDQPGPCHPIAAAVSWSGACHDGPGLFAGWYPLYYEETEHKGYATIPVGWRDDLLISRQWFDEIRDSCPMDGYACYPGPVLAIAGTADPIVPYEHAQEILARCRHPESQALILPDSDHTFCVLTEDQTLAEQVLESTASWFSEHLSFPKPPIF